MPTSLPPRVPDGPTLTASEGTEVSADGRGVSDDALDAAIAEALTAFEALRADDGHWIFELEADATIPSEYILLNHYLGEIDDALEAEIASYIRDRQNEDGGWPLFHGGATDISCSVKAYYALKLSGDPVDSPHMKRARTAIRKAGGAAHCNVFTRTTLALFGQVPWRAVPVMPVEIMLLPKAFPFHLSKISYWSRTVLVPLLILMALRPKAFNPRGIGIEELFTTPAWTETRYFQTRDTVSGLFLGIDRLLQVIGPMFPRRARDKAIDKAVAFIVERLNGDDGLGAIFPAMANALMAFDALGYAPDHPHRVTARTAIDKLVVRRRGYTYVQPCLSPVWDTALAAHAVLEAGAPETARPALDWLVEHQVLDLHGDWAENRPGLRPGGWAFQYANAHYPDVDDTAVVVMALERADTTRYGEAIARGTEWIVGMQSSNGGWGAFDIDNAAEYLNHIPFADHGALLDPPTVDVTARCVGMLAQCGHKRTEPMMARALAYLRSEQEADGSWFGRWGTNYIYGTWSALAAFNAAGEDLDAPHIRKAVHWLESRQRPDGGWGEDGATYWSDSTEACQASTASQTAWALLGLMAAGEADSDAVARGIAYLLAASRQGARWDEDWFTAVGFPRVFYLRYHGYAAYFPLWALARYRNLRRGNARTTPFGI